MSFPERYRKTLHPFSPRHPLPDRGTTSRLRLLPAPEVRALYAGRLACPVPVEWVLPSPGWKSRCWWATISSPLPPRWCPSGLGDQSFIPEQTCPRGPHALIRGDNWPEEGPRGSLHRKGSSFLANFNLPLSECVHVFSVTAGPRSSVNSGISVWVQPSVNSSCTSFLSHFMDRSRRVQSPSYNLTPCSAWGEAHNLAWCLWEPHCNTYSQNKLCLPSTLCLSPCLCMLREWASEKTAEIYLMPLRNLFYLPPGFLKDNNRKGNYWLHGPFSPFAVTFSSLCNTKKNPKRERDRERARERENERESERARTNNGAPSSFHPWMGTVFLLLLVVTQIINTLSVRKNTLKF